MTAKTNWQSLAKAYRQEIVAQGQRIAALEAICRDLLGWLDASPEPLPAGHTCGPESNCDCNCMNVSYMHKAMSRARAALLKGGKDAD